jgi:VanZ family protein
MSAEKDSGLSMAACTSGGVSSTSIVLSRYAVLIGWMAVIWMFSAQPNSAAETRHYFGTFNFCVRKLAHFTEYAILAVLALWCFRSHGKNPNHRLLKLIGGSNVVSAAVAFAALYACSDEIHQAFVPGRGAAILDVLVDSSGAFTSISILRFLEKRRRK